MDKYQKVSCDFYDQLEAFATQKKELSISYWANDSLITNDIITIKTLETKNKEEFLITTSGLRIRLDKIMTAVEV